MNRFKWKLHQQNILQIFLQFFLEHDIRMHFPRNNIFYADSYILGSLFYCELYNKFYSYNKINIFLIIFYFYSFEDNLKRSLFSKHGIICYFESWIIIHLI